MCTHVVLTEGSWSLEGEPTTHSSLYKMRISSPNCFLHVSVYHVCVCVSCMCMCDVCVLCMCVSVCVHMCMWRTEADTGCFPQLLSILFYWVFSLDGRGAQEFGCSFRAPRFDSLHTHSDSQSFVNHSQGTHCLLGSEGSSSASLGLGLQVSHCAHPAFTEALES